MSFIRAIVRASLLAVLIGALQPGFLLFGQEPEKAPVTTIKVASRLVFLDVTVLDKSGHPVVTGLTRDDFTISEGKRPQRIFSFEAPESHTTGDEAASDDTVGKAPVTILVLDLLNSSYDDFAYIRFELERYLTAQPAQLATPCELMVLGNNSLQMVQGYTRNREDLISALHHMPRALPYKLSPAFIGERFIQSTSALKQIALQNKGIPGRKNIIWLGQGSPSIKAEDVIGKSQEWVGRYMRNTTDLLVDARVTLYVLHLSLGLSLETMYVAAAANSAQHGHDPFAEGLNFGVFMSETGGKFFYNRNDVDGEIKDAQKLGSNYYTLTYQPQESVSADTFKPIKVTVRNSEFTVMTKTGYFSPETVGTVESRHHVITDLNEAVLSDVPFRNLQMALGQVVRHPDTGTAEFTVNLGLKDLSWQQGEDGKSTANLRLAAVCMTAQRGIAASRVETVTVQSPTDDPTLRPKYITQVSLTLRVPRQTKNIRVVMQTVEGGRLGSVDVDRKTLDAASATPTPAATLIARPTPRSRDVPAKP
ncbi:VWA domain-containing protein [Granulicella arctica]|uniref:VWA domain-containing protein n=1 Tax=Granulicella arctica TaxID=940613 RepID=UPI0021DF56F3|nr:VWA domain-containing protein [Granulicella arctica]